MKRGKSLLITLSGCFWSQIDDEIIIEDFIKTLAKMAKVDIITIAKHKFQPEGFTALALLSQSHLTFHNYIESKSFVVDLYSCSDETDFDKCKDFIINQFYHKSHEFQIIER